MAFSCRMLLGLSALVIQFSRSVDASPQLGHGFASPESGLRRRQVQPPAKSLTIQTSTWPISQVVSTYDFAWVASETLMTYATTGMVTQIQTLPTAFPAAVVKTVMSHMTVTKSATGWDNEVFPPKTYTESRTTTFTAHFYLPQPTDLAEGTKIWGVPCQECLSSDYKPDPQCEALGLLTACQGQCKQVDGVWECREIWPDEFRNGPDFLMGRACWKGNSSDYKPLWTPCVAGDHQIGCTPCKGNLYDYSPQKWYS
jgi:hypothetical protein